MEMTTQGFAFRVVVARADIKGYLGSRVQALGFQARGSGVSV